MLATRLPAATALCRATRRESRVRSTPPGSTPPDQAQVDAVQAAMLEQLKSPACVCAAALRSVVPNSPRFSAQKQMSEMTAFMGNPKVQEVRCEKLLLVVSRR